MTSDHQEHFGHLFDHDEVCVDCGFDGTKWHWWRYSTYEGKAQPNAKQPLCTKRGRVNNQYLENGDDY